MFGIGCSNGSNGSCEAYFIAETGKWQAESAKRDGQNSTGRERPDNRAGIGSMQKLQERRME